MLPLVALRTGVPLRGVDRPKGLKQDDEETRARQRTNRSNQRPRPIDETGESRLRRAAAELRAPTQASDSLARLWQSAGKKRSELHLPRPPLTLRDRRRV